MRRHIVFSDVVCLSIGLSVRLSVHHAFVFALYLLNPWWDFQIPLHKGQVWWVDVQCVCLTKVGSRSRSYRHSSTLNIVWLYFMSALYFFNPLWDFQITLQNVMYAESMSSAYVWPRSVQVQDHSLRLNIVCLRPFTKFNNSDFHFNKIISYPMLQRMVIHHFLR